MYIVTKDKQFGIAVYEGPNFPREPGTWVIEDPSFILNVDEQGRIPLTQEQIDLAVASEVIPVIRTLSSSNAPIQEINYKVNINLKQGRLHRQDTFDNGYLVRVDYYRDFDGQNYSVPVLKVEVDYQPMGNTGGPSSRTTTRTWYNTDGSEVPKKKITQKHYSLTNSMKAGIRRRQNVVDNLQTEIAETILPSGFTLEDGRALFVRHRASAHNYIQTAKSDIIGAVLADQDLMLNTMRGNMTIREHIALRLEGAI